MIPPEIAERIRLPGYPRSAHFDPGWQLDNAMGTNPCWLSEALFEQMRLRPGMRALDLGCGRGVSSIFLAKEYGLQVWAADLWTNPDETWARVREMGLDHAVFPLRGEALTLPFAEAFFDVIVSVDAWHFFGESDDFLSATGRYLKPGGQVGIIGPGLQRELPETLPDDLLPFWQQEFWTFHSADWWRGLWGEAAEFAVNHADVLPDGPELWQRWETICRDAGYPYAPDDLLLLAADDEHYLGFVRVIADKIAPSPSLPA